MYIGSYWNILRFIHFYTHLFTFANGERENEIASKQYISNKQLVNFV